MNIDELILKAWVEMHDETDYTNVVCSNFSLGFKAAYKTFSDANNCQCIEKNGEPVNQCDECPR